MTFGGRRKRRGWLAAGAVVVVGGAAGAVLLFGGDNADSTPPATVQVKRGEVTSSVIASGTVQPVGTRELAFAVAGTLTSIAVKPGDQVTAGGILATIDPADARAAVDQAQTALNQAEQTLAEARQAATDAAAAAQAAAKASATVRVCASSTPAVPSTSPSASYSTGPGLPTPSCTPTGGSPGGNTGGTGNSGGGSVTRGGDAIYSAEVTVNKAEQTLAKAKRQLAGTTITAPVDGKVLSVGGRSGDPVGTGTFIKLGVVTKMMVQAQFAEADAVTLAVGQQATVTLANRAGEQLPVTITQVAAVGTASSQLVRYTVLLAFDGAPQELLIGQSATAQVVLNRETDVLYLPQSAVKVTAGGAGEVKLADGTVRSVQVGLRGDGNVAVTGLAEGDTVRQNARS